MHTTVVVMFQNLSRRVVQTSVCLTTPLTPQITLRSRVVSRSMVCGLQSLSVLLIHRELTPPSSTTRHHHVMFYIAVSSPQMILRTFKYWTVPWLSLQRHRQQASNLGNRSMTSCGKRPLFALSVPAVVSTATRSLLIFLCLTLVISVFLACHFTDWK